MDRAAKLVFHAGRTHDYRPNIYIFLTVNYHVLVDLFLRFLTVQAETHDWRMPTAYCKHFSRASGEMSQVDQSLFILPNSLMHGSRMCECSTKTPVR